MKKTFYSVVALAMVLLAASGYRSDNADSGVGAAAPALEFSNGRSSVDLSQMRGEYVLLSFWSAKDAVSRVDCNRYSAWAKDLSVAGLRHISVNTDDDAALFEEVVKRDGLDAASQYNVGGNAAREIYRSLGIAEGYGAVLIGPDGKIIGYNPDKQTLNKLKRAS